MPTPESPINSSCKRGDRAHVSRATERVGASQSSSTPSRASATVVCHAAHLKKVVVLRIGHAAQTRLQNQASVQFPTATSNSPERRLLQQLPERCSNRQVSILKQGQVWLNECFMARCKRTEEFDFVRGPSWAIICGLRSHGQRLRVPVKKLAHPSPTTPLYR